MATILKHYGSDSVPLEEDLVYDSRGDGNRYYTFAHGFLASEIVSAEFTAENSSGTDKITIHSSTQTTQWDFSTNYTATLFFIAGDTSALTGTDLALTYDIQFILNDTNPVTVAKGSFTVKADIST